MTMVASFMPSLAFAAASTSDPLDATHTYVSDGIADITNTVVKGWLADENKPAKRSQGIFLLAGS